MGILAIDRPVKILRTHEDELEPLITDAVERRPFDIVSTLARLAAKPQSVG